MNRFALISGCTLLCALLIWLGLTAARADLSPADPATSQASTSESGSNAGTAVASTSVASTSTTSASSATGPSTQSLVEEPQTMPSLPPITAVPSGTLLQQKPMPREYWVLLSRSMFVRGHVAEAGHASQHFSGPSTAPSLDRAETGLIFNGVTQTANTIDALVEDTISGKVITVHTGDAIARGRVKAITFDTLEYESNGRVTAVQIGQNLAGNGVDVSAIPTTTAPAGSGASPQDILERLRQRRLQESGGGR